MIDICKIRKVKNPERGTNASAGIDIFIPEFDFAFRKEFSELNKSTGSIIGTSQIAIPPQCGVLIPSGIRYQIPKDHVLVAMNKSGVSSKTGLLVGACVCDQDYQGEYIISLINTSDVPVKIQSGKKIVQLLLLPVVISDIRFLPEEDFDKVATERGAGGFGSTGER